MTDQPAPLMDALPGVGPPSSRTLGLEILTLDTAAGMTRVRFRAREEFTNPSGFVQGGFAAAMLDDAIGMLSWLTLEGKGVPSTIDLSLHYHRPLRPGLVEVAARITAIGRTVIFAEADLFDARGKLCVQARTSLAIIRPGADNLQKPEENQQGGLQP